MGCGAIFGGKQQALSSCVPVVQKDVIQKSTKPGGGFSGANFILENRGLFKELYTMEKKKLGEGSYGSVSKAKENMSGVWWAVKTISKVKMKNVDRFRQEIQIMKIMDHPNICKLNESFEDKVGFYLVMELCEGGELFDRIIDMGHFTEKDAAITMQHMFRAIYYMHSMKICHRDLKPENFLFTSKDPIDQSTLKVIDFGLACKFEEGQVLTTKAGTPYYVAPQVLAGKYDQSSDLWSLGVIMYVLLCGYPPFYGDSDTEVLAKVRLGNFTFGKAEWKDVSEDAKLLIRWLLKMNPKDRCTGEQALNHVWVKNLAPQAGNMSLQASMVDNLRGFRSQNKLKKAALHVIAAQLKETQIKALRDTFMSLDGNGDGLLTVQEMTKGLLRAGLKEVPADLKQIMEEVDSDGSGHIDYTEFLAATLDKSEYIKEDVCWHAFRRFDRNDDGKISHEEMLQVLADGEVHAAVAEDMRELMEEIDANGDGEIDFEEFMAMMRGETHRSRIEAEGP